MSKVAASKAWVSACSVLVRPVFPPNVNVPSARSSCTCMLHLSTVAWYRSISLQAALNTREAMSLSVRKTRLLFYRAVPCAFRESTQSAALAMLLSLLGTSTSLNDWTPSRKATILNAVVARNCSCNTLCVLERDGVATVLVSPLPSLFLLKTRLLVQNHGAYPNLRA